jgi:hypothetical protein
MRDLIFEGEALPIRAIRWRGSYPAKEWVQGLSERDFKRALAGARSADVAAASGRGFAGRIAKISGSSYGLVELRLTRGGTTGPQLRLLGVLRDGAFYAAHGFSKKSPKFAGEIATAEQRVRAWLEDVQDERRRAPAQRRNRRSRRRPS